MFLLLYKDQPARPADMGIRLAANTKNVYSLLLDMVLRYVQVPITHWPMDASWSYSMRVVVDSK
jgi:hypothetical protein